MANEGGQAQARVRSALSARWRILAIVLGLLIVLIVIVNIAAKLWLAPIAQRKMIEAVASRFQSELEVERVSVSLLPSVHLSAENLVFHHHGRRDVPPLIKVRRVSGNAGLFGLLTGPTIDTVNLEGLEIRITKSNPAKDGAAKAPEQSQSGNAARVKQVVADGALLQIMPKEPGKDPLTFNIYKLTLNDAGPDRAMAYRAQLKNARPPGLIDATGDFGPWKADDPGETPLTGDYNFKDADLSVFKGIQGKLSSTGQFRGTLERIEAQGTTDTPDFALKAAGHPVHLKTEYKATIDGTSGDTYLHPVNAQFRNSNVEASGSIAQVPGTHGKTVSLDASVERGRVEDMLFLAVKSDPPILNGAISFKTKIVIPPGDVDVVQKLKLDGSFQIASGRFTKGTVQKQVDSLSARAQGEPERADNPPGVASAFRGGFHLDHGTIHFSRLSFNMPGAAIDLNGSYGLQSEALDFSGTAKLEARISETMTGVKSFFLKALDPFFAKKNAGAVVPIKISGTRTDPKFGLRLGK